MSRQSWYQKHFIQMLGCTPDEARWLEAYANLEWGSLGSVSNEQFAEVWADVVEIASTPEGRAMAEELAESYGL